MLVTFHKINPKEYKLQIKRQDESEDEAILDYREFLKHDLVHFVVEKNAGADYGFYGSLAKGKKLIELSPKYQKEQGITADKDLMLIEMVVGPIQGALKQGEMNVDQLLAYLDLQEGDIPNFLTQSFINNTIREVQSLVKWYDGLKVGEKLVLEFFEHEPQKSYCSDPKSMANVFGNLNKLGK